MAIVLILNQDFSVLSGKIELSQFQIDNKEEKNFDTLVELVENEHIQLSF